MIIINYNFQLIDLGQPAYSANSKKDCWIKKEKQCDRILPLFQDSSGRKQCHFTAYCQGEEEAENKQSLSQDESSHCSCSEETGAFPSCRSYIRPVTLGVKSYASIALSFVPDPQRVTIQLRFRTKSENGLLVKLNSRKATFSLSLQVSLSKMNLFRNSAKNCKQIK